VYATARPARGACQCAVHGAPGYSAGSAAPKKSRHADERDTERVQHARAASQEESSARDSQRVKFIDDSGGNRAMTRLYGRAPRGEGVVGTIPQTYGAHVTLLAALGSHGVEAVMTLEGATEAEVFRVSVEQVLCPTRRPGALVMMDNLRAHKAPGLREAMVQAGAQGRSLPPYSPDLAPLEPCWSKLKPDRRQAKARTRAALDDAIAQALATITVSDARSWFHYGGYALQ
jgi:transposase